MFLIDIAHNLCARRTKKTDSLACFGLFSLLSFRIYCLFQHIPERMDQLQFCGSSLTVKYSVWSDTSCLEIVILGREI